MQNGGHTNKPPRLNEKEVANATMAISKQNPSNNGNENNGGNGKHRRDGDSGYTKSGPSPGDADSEKIQCNGRRKKTDQPLEVQVSFVEISDEEREERMDRLANVLLDGAVNFLKHSKSSKTV